ncbi:hypothetical protein ACLQ2D_02005 [Streptomyces sp. DT199]|uniref:hypothetical protein n=1 Tax=Streptomyces sp. DT199 TaxID=3393421 RepID=UPI003CEACEEB
MLADAVSRSSHPGVRTGAALLVLMAALMHLLACAHGPTSAAAGRTDTFLAVSPPCAQPPEPPADPAARQTAPAPGNGERCWGLDEPSVQPPRDITRAVQAVQDALPADHLSALPPSPVPQYEQSGRSECGLPPTGQERARLGVWRT